MVHQDPGIREILSAAYGEAGCYVTSVDTVEAAAEVLAQQEFDRAIVDLLMPGVWSETASEHRLDFIPMDRERILFITGYVVNQSTVGFLVTSGSPSAARLMSLAGLMEITVGSYSG